MDDDYTKLKRELEAIDVAAERQRLAIQRLIEHLRWSDHPLKKERIARLEQLLDCLKE